MRTGLRLRLPPRVGGNRPVRQVGIANRTVVLVQILPDLVEIVKVTAQSETGAGALECLGFRARRRILVVRPFLADAGVRPKAVHGYRRNDHDLGANDALLLSVSAPVERRSKFCAT